MVFTRKFSEFVDGGPQETDDRPVGLEDDANTIWEFTGGSGSGDTIVTITQDTSALMVGRWVRANNAGVYVHALATSAEEAEVSGVIREILSPTQFRLQQSGYIPSGTPGFSGFALGTTFFLSDTLPGVMTDTPPTDNGMVRLPLFLSDQTDSGWVASLKTGYIIGTPGPIPSSGSGSNPLIVNVNQPGNMFMIGQVVRVSADATYGLSSGTTLANAQAIGFVKVSGDPIFTVQFAGYVSNVVIGAVDAVGAPIALVAATTYYVSAIVPGAITPTIPTNPNYSRPIYICESVINGTGWILPQRPLQDQGSSENPIIIVVNQPAHGLNEREWLRIDGAGLYVTAQANTEANANAIGVIVEVIDADNFRLQQIGFTEAGAWLGQLNPSTVYYLSPTLAGAKTTTKPTTPGQYVKQIMTGKTTDSGWIQEFDAIRVTEDEETIIVEVNQPGHGLNEREWLRINGVGNYVTAQANSETNANAIGVVIRKIDDDNFILQQIGFTDAPTWAAQLGSGLVWYLSPTSAGAMTLTKPTTAGQYIKQVMTGKNANSGWIQEFDARAISASGAGIVQVVYSVTRTTVTTTFTALTWTAVGGVSIAITPGSVLSKVKLTFNLMFRFNSAGANIYFRLLRNGVVVSNLVGGNPGPSIPVSFGTIISTISQLTFITIDEPATIAATTYTLEAYSSSSILFNLNLDSAISRSAISTYIAEEIA